MMSSAIREDNSHVLHGPKPTSPLDDEMLGVTLHRKLLHMPKDSIAMIDAFTNEKLCYRDLHQRAVNLAGSLRKCGYAAQNTVFSICTENSLDFFVPLIAVLFNGGIVAPLNHCYTLYELEHSLAISRPEIVFCSAAVLPKFVQLKRQLGHIKRIIVLAQAYSQEAGVQSLEEFVSSQLAGTTVDVGAFRATEGDPKQAIAFIMCSSGTTGLPKGVALSHLNVQVRFAHSRELKNPSPSELQHGRTLLGLMPFYHCYGLFLSLSALSNGNKIVCLKKFDEDVLLRSIQDYRISILALAPPLAVFLVKSDKVDLYDLSSVETIFCGAAPLKQSTEEGLKRRLHCQDSRQGYGMTEATLSVTGLEDGHSRAGSCGKVRTYVAAKVRDPASGRSLGPKQVGELCFKGPFIMLGYYKNELATRETLTSDGWLKTGDLGYYDEDGFFYVIDRLKELIKYKGFQVAPAELEAILLNHPKVSDVGLVGLPDELVGERPLAFVVRKPGCEVMAKELEAYVAGLVSPQKRLSGGIIFVDSIPKSPSGKILRRELKDLLKEHRQTAKSKL